MYVLGARSQLEGFYGWLLMRSSSAEDEELIVEFIL